MKKILQLLEQQPHNPELYHQLGMYYYQQGQLDFAQKALNRALKYRPNFPETHVLLGDIYLYKEQMDQALECFSNVLKFEPNHILVNIKAANIYRLKEQVIPALQHFEKALNLTLEHDALAGLNHETNAIFINTLPKSGSVYITNALTEGLERSVLRISSDISFGKDLITPYNFEIFVREGHISQEHLPALPENIDFLERYLEKWMIHVRDPRQALLSWSHFVLRFQSKHFKIDQYLPSHYNDLSFAQQLDWQIENHFPVLVEWLMDWVKAEKRLKGRILFTRYTDLHSRPEWFFEQILDFWGIPDDTFIMPEPPKKGQKHFRKGKLNEWRSVFSQRQQDQINAKVPDELLEFFDWKR